MKIDDKTKKTLLQSKTLEAEVKKKVILLLIFFNYFTF